MISGAVQVGFFVVSSFFFILQFSYSSILQFFNSLYVLILITFVLLAEKTSERRERPKSATFAMMSPFSNYFFLMREEKERMKKKAKRKKGELEKKEKRPDEAWYWDFLGRDE